MNERVLHGLLVGLLALALVQAALLARGGGEARVYVPLLAAGDPPGSLQGEGAAARVLAERAGVGEFVTVEDLARGVLALEGGTLPGAAPLTDAEKSKIDPLLRQAAEDRLALLAVEGEIAAAEAQLVSKASEIAATLTPEQRAWIVANRDLVSVGQIEQAYWEELTRGAAPGSGDVPPPPAPR